MQLILLPRPCALRGGPLKRRQAVGRGCWQAAARRGVDVRHCNDTGLGLHKGHQARLDRRQECYHTQAREAAPRRIRSSRKCRPSAAVALRSTCSSSQTLPHPAARYRAAATPPLVGVDYQEDRLLVAEVGCSRSLFAVFDGHGGHAVSEFLAQHTVDVVRRALAGTASSAAALHTAFRTLDAALPPASSSQGGSTALVVMLDDDKIVCANAGDSRAVLSRSGKAVALSEDHKPDNDAEEARVKKAGGSIITNGGVRRVMGVLSMTRAIGDAWLQQYGVIPEPEVKEHKRQPEDELLILASDGLWDVVSNQEAVDIARRCLLRACVKGASCRAASQIAAKVLVRVATDRGSRDNISVVVVNLASDASLPAAGQRPCIAASQTAGSMFRHHSDPSKVSCKSSSLDASNWPLSLPRLLSAERLAVLVSASSAPSMLIFAS